MQSPISIVIPTYGRADLTAQCLASIRKTTPDGVELIVVDDGEASGSTAHMIRNEFPDVKLVVLDENKGFAAACNAGLQEVTREFVIFANNDLIFDSPGWWKPALRQAQKPGVGVVGAMLTSRGRRLVNHLGISFTNQRRPEVPSLPLPCHLYRDVPGSILPRKAKRARELQAVTGALMVMRTAVALKAGGFDEDYRNGFEDVDLCFRLRRDFSLTTWIEPMCSAQHLESQSDGRFDKEHENAERFAEKWCDDIKIDVDELLSSDGWA